VQDAGCFGIMHQIAADRIGMAVPACASAQPFVELTARRLRERAAFGETLALPQVPRHRRADILRRTQGARACVRLLADTPQARAYVRRAAERAQAGEDAVAEVAMAKNTATEALDQAVDGAVQLHGGEGFLRDSEVERHYRAARVFSIGGGTYEIMNEVIAKHLPLR